MRKMISAADIAGLPGVPGTVNGVNRAALRLGWAFDARPGRGGGRLYDVACLPPAARDALVARELARAPAPLPPPAQREMVLDGSGPPAPLKAWQRRVMEARLAILAEVRKVGQAVGDGAAERAFEAAAKARSLSPETMALVVAANARPGDVQKRTVSAATLRRWRLEFATSGPEALAPAPASREREGQEPWLPYVMTLRRLPSKPSIAACFEELPKVLPPGVPMPGSLRSVQRAISQLGAIEKNRGRMGPRELKTLRAYKVRSVDDLEAGDVYTADGHCVDFEVEHPSSRRPFRPEIVTVLDVRTRRAVGWSAHQAESTHLVADALRHSCETAGDPAIFYVDNGPGFKNRAFDGPVIGLMNRLGITKERSLPYNSQARGVIERFNATCWVRAAKKLPTYMGAPMDREARQIAYKRVRKDLATVGASRCLMSWVEFLHWAQIEIDAYNNRPHSFLPRVRDAETLKLRHQTPAESWLELAARDAAVTPIAPELAATLFRPVEVRKVDRAQVRLWGGTYFARELETLDLHGREVLVAYDIHDPSRVFVRDFEGRPLCTAELDGNKTPYFPKARVEQAREKRAESRLKRLQGHADDARAELRGEAASTRPHLSLVPAAPAPAPARQTAAAEEEAAAEHRRILAELAAPRHEPISDEDEMYARACALEARLAAGVGLSEDETAFLAWAQTAWWYAPRRETEDWYAQHLSENRPA